jgi:hypothetical protein
MNHQEPAFPLSARFTQGGQEFLVTNTGMSLRDWFAGQFIQGGDPVDFDIRMRHDVAKYAYMMADAMIAAREHVAENP